jgi:hypothetical protein
MPTRIIRMLRPLLGAARGGPAMLARRAPMALRAAGPARLGRRAPMMLRAGRPAAMARRMR